MNILLGIGIFLAGIFVGIYLVAILSANGRDDDFPPPNNP